MAHIRGILVALVLSITFLSVSLLLWLRHTRRTVQVPAYLDSQWDVLKEKRKFVRFEKNLPVTCIIEEKAGGIHHLFSRNVSGAGICLVVPEMLPEGARLDLKIELPNDDPITVTGEVVWVKESIDKFQLTGRFFNTGIKFRKIESKDKTRLSRYLLSAVWLEENR